VHDDFERLRGYCCAKPGLKVALQKTIARGDPGCVVTVYLRQTDESEQDSGREYFQS
jgi:hypothetical protein